MQKSNEMSKAAVEARKAYRREWYKANPEKQKEYQARYWNKKAQAAREGNT